MSAITVVNKRGEQCGTVEIDDALLLERGGEQAVHDVVVAYLAGRRAGTASTLTKGTVAGSNKKPWRQKGLGRARAGYRRSPLWRGGGVVFGPHPRSYAKHVNAQVRRLALRRVFSEKLRAGAIKVVDTLALPDAKTKSMRQVLRDLALTGRVLVIAARLPVELARAVRNLPLVELTSAQNVNVYQLLRYPALLVEQPAWQILVGRLQGKQTETVAQK